MNNMSRKKKNVIKKFKPNYDYDVDYNDHFETPLQAYEDILPLLDSIAPNRNQHIVYDPYYCNGSTKILLQQLGFQKVVHEKRDFYKDIANKKVPPHHTLVTNPPYSDDHKEKCLDYCVKGFLEYNRPFFLLIPSYVAARSYYRRILGATLHDVAYVVPSEEYSYDHPEGTGHEESPFQSLWFCCIGKNKIEKVATKFDPTNGPQFIQSFDELERKGVISLQNRKNPKQRKKLRKQLAVQSALGTMAQSNNNETKTNNKNSNNTPKGQPKKKKCNSKYRNKTGERTKKRF